MGVMGGKFDCKDCLAHAKPSFLSALALSDSPRQSPAVNQARILFRYRLVLGFFIVALAVSGLTAFPLQYELDTLTSLLGLRDATVDTAAPGLAHWLVTVRDGLRDTNAKYPWLAYGTDWLAFAHLMLALFFIGPWVKPRRNVWVLWAGLLACAFVIPLALICGPLRGIPFGWRLIDCSFGVFGSLPLLYCLWLVRQMPSDDSA
jgi:hypothetical protein